LERKQKENRIKMSTQQLQTRTQTAVQLRGLVESDAYKKRFNELLRDRAPQFVASMVQLVNASQQLQNCDPHSIIAAAITAAAMDLPIEKNLGFAHIVPYGNQASFQIGYKGLIQLAVRTGKYRFLNYCVVYDGELIDYNKMTGQVVIDPKKKVSEKVLGYAAYFQLVNGYEHAEFWYAQEVEEHAQRFSQAYRMKKQTPWLTDFNEMALKTVIKSLLSHWGILSIEMQRAVIEDQSVRVDVDSPASYPDNDGTADPKKPDMGVPLSLMPPVGGQSETLPPPPAPPAPRRGRPPKQQATPSPATAIAPTLPPEPPIEASQPDDLPFDASSQTPQEPPQEPEADQNPFEAQNEPVAQAEAQPEAPAAPAAVTDPPELVQLRTKLGQLGLTEEKVMAFMKAKKLAIGENSLADFVTSNRINKLKSLLGALDNKTWVEQIKVG
jgi:recombination protein RecT